MSFAFFRIIEASFILIDPRVDINTKVSESLAFFTLFNSLFWAFLIPKIIYNEIYKKIILN